MALQRAPGMNATTLRYFAFDRKPEFDRPVDILCSQFIPRQTGFVFGGYRSERT
jgi:hypothetical protein